MTDQPRANGRAQRPGCRKPVIQFNGVLFKDAVERESKAGNQYTKLAVRVDVEDRAAGSDDWPTPMFIGVMVFGGGAEHAAGGRKGDRCIVQGSLERRTWKTDEGGTRESWTVLADACTLTRPRAAGGAGGRLGEYRRPRPAAAEPPPLTEADIPF